MSPFFLFAVSAKSYLNCVDKALYLWFHNHNLIWVLLDFPFRDRWSQHSWIFSKSVSNNLLLLWSKMERERRFWKLHTPNPTQSICCIRILLPVTDWKLKVRLDKNPRPGLNPKKLNKKISEWVVGSVHRVIGRKKRIHMALVGRFQIA